MSYLDPLLLSNVARAYGVRPPPVDRARIIELGCGRGQALLPLAMRLPHALFVGIDASSTNARAMTERARTLELHNVVCMHGDWSMAVTTLGTYDYVLCNDHLSSVSIASRPMLLALCKALLAPSGIACFSYAVDPTWQVCRSRSHRPATGRQRGRTPNTPLPGILGRANQRGAPTGRYPLLFAEFAALLDMHALQFVGEASMEATLATYLAPEVRYLARSGRTEDIIAREQYADIELGRRVRHSLIMHQHHHVERDLTRLPVRAAA
ncbi:methyltransferase domain-containing protein [Oxalobacteraceae bacterium OM1]|nr:methyltransferase domain-containing protein [Oxalobacteraceae bacterium OM1]